MRCNSKLGVYSLVALVSGAMITSASAAVLISDPFSYSDGNLVGNTPPVGGTWAAHSGAGSVPVQVSGGQISLVQGSGSREDVNSTYQGGFALGAGGKLYSSFDLTVADPGATVQDVNFSEFLAGTSTFDARLWMSAPATSGYRLALSNDNSDTDNDGEVRTGDLAFGQTYKVVTLYDYDAQKGTIWINPTSEGSPSFTAVDPGFSDASTAYAFRQGTGNTTQVIDNLKVGTSFTDVAVPEPASLSLVLLGGFGMLCRRRRA